MPQMKRVLSPQRQIERCEGLLGTNSLTEWEEQFITDLAVRLKAGTLMLTERQKEVLGRVFDKHFSA